MLRGRQTNGSFLPERRTDFIFTVVAEETGFAGSVALLALLVGLCLTGMIEGLMPPTGIPLLLLSYGGSGLSVEVAAVGSLCSIARERGRRVVSP